MCAAKGERKIDGRKSLRPNHIATTTLQQRHGNSGMATTTAKRGIGYPMLVLTRLDLLRSSDCCGGRTKIMQTSIVEKSGYGSE